MPQVDDYTAMREWDLATAVLKDVMAAVRFPGGGDFSTAVMDSGDVDLTAGDVLDQFTAMEDALLHETATASNRAFLKDFSQLCTVFKTWYISGANGGYSGISAALAARHYRIPYLMASAWKARQGGTVAAANLGLYKDVPLYQAIRANAARLIAALPTDVLYAPLVLECNGGIGAQILSVVLGVTYGDDTAGTETTSVTNGSVTGTRFQVAALPITGHGATSGLAVVPMTSTAGMVAGQKVLVRDAAWTTKLTSDLAATGTVLIVENSRPFSPGDAVHLHDDATSDENATILDVDHETNTITLSAGATGGFSQGAHAHLRLATPDDYGWTEVMTILSVQANVSITLTGNLVNSYSADGYVQRLIKTITTMTTSGGTGGDCVDLLAVPDRYNFGALNSSSSSSSSRSVSSSSSSSSISSSSSSSARSQLSASETPIKRNRAFGTRCSSRPQARKVSSPRCRRREG